MSTTTTPTNTTAPTDSPVCVLYTVAWTGGFEDPSFASYTDPAHAEAKAEEWKNESGDSGDRVCTIEHTVHPDGTVTTEIIDDWAKGWEADTDEDTDEEG